MVISQTLQRLIHVTSLLLQKSSFGFVATKRRCSKKSIASLFEMTGTAKFDTVWKFFQIWAAED
jgi:hypothetical protein